MSEWIERPLSMLAEITGGGTPSRNIAEYWEGDIPWVTPTDITACSSNYLSSTADLITNSGLMNSSAKMLPAGSILLTSRASIGLSKIANIPVCTNQGFKSLQPRSEVDGTFLFYQIQRLKGQFERYAAGSTFLEINKKDTARIAIPLPAEKHTQKKIASILANIDATIEKTEALIEKYQLLKAGLMQDLFTRGVLPNGQLRPLRSIAPELYQETTIGWIPADWDATTLRSACDWYSGGTPSKQNEEWWKGTLPWLSPKDMKCFELADTKDHVTRYAAMSGSRIAPKGSVFIVVRGMILAHSFPVVINSEEFSFNQDVKSVIGRASLKNRYLAYWFVANTNLFLNKTTESTHGTKRFDLNDLYKISIGIPSETEQDRIINRLDIVEKKITAEMKQEKKLKKQKLGLMQDLLTGKVQVQVDKLDVTAA